LDHSVVECWHVISKTDYVKFLSLGTTLSISCCPKIPFVTSWWQSSRNFLPRTTTKNVPQQVLCICFHFYEFSVHVYKFKVSW